MMRTKLNLHLLLLSLTLSIGMPGIALAQDSDAKVRKDLKTVLALQGKSCNVIETIKALAENDYLVTCKDGNRYRIWIDADDHVVIEDR